MQRHFHEELDALKQTLLAMGGLVEDQIRRVMRALVDRDGALAQEVIDRDRQVNAYDVEVDEKCVELLALHQPTAKDLRFITTTRSEEHTSELQSLTNLVCRLLLEKKKKKNK